jgi:hypothetical protein
MCCNEWFADDIAAIYLMRKRSSSNLNLCLFRIRPVRLVARFWRSEKQRAHEKAMGRSYGLLMNRGYRNQLFAQLNLCTEGIVGVGD